VICLNVNTMTSNMMNDGAVCTIVKKEEGDDERCRFMEAVIDHKQFPETDIALQADTMLLNIFEYIKAVNYQIDQFMVNRFWQSMSAKNSYITCDIAVFEWLGYDNEGGARKQTFLKLLKANAITHKQIKHTDDDFDQYSEAVEEAKTLSPAALKSQKWIVLNSNDFKRVVFNIKTKRAQEIHNYYLSLEQLFAMYAEYTRHFLMRRERQRAELEKTDLIAMMERMRLDQAEQHRQQMDHINEYVEEARDDRDAMAKQVDVIAKQNETITKQNENIAQKLDITRKVAVPEVKKGKKVQKRKLHKFGIFRKSPTYQWVEGDPNYLKEADVRVVRRQEETFNAEFRKFKSLGNSTNADATIVHSFVNPNPINLVNRLKTEYPQAFIYHAPTGIQFTEENGPDDLIRLINNLHEVRMEYPEQAVSSDSE